LEKQFGELFLAAKCEAGTVRRTVAEHGRRQRRLHPSLSANKNPFCHRQKGFLNEVALAGE